MLVMKMEKCFGASWGWRCVRIGSYEMEGSKERGYAMHDDMFYRIYFKDNL